MCGIFFINLIFYFYFTRKFLEKVFTALIQCEGVPENR